MREEACAPTAAREHERHGGTQPPSSAKCIANFRVCSANHCGRRVVFGLCWHPSFHQCCSHVHVGMCIATTHTRTRPVGRADACMHACAAPWGLVLAQRLSLVRLSRRRRRRTSLALGARSLLNRPCVCACVGACMCGCGCVQARGCATGNKHTLHGLLSTAPNKQVRCCCAPALNRCTCGGARSANHVGRHAFSDACMCVHSPSPFLRQGVET